MNNTCKKFADFHKNILKRETIKDLSNEELAHVKSCAACQQALARFEKLEQAMKKFAHDSLTAIPVRKIALPPKPEPEHHRLIALINDFLTPFRLAATVAMIVLIALLWQADLKQMPGNPDNFFTLVSGEIFSETQDGFTDEKLIAADLRQYSNLGKTIMRKSGVELSLINASFVLADDHLHLHSGKVTSKVASGNPWSITTDAAEIQVLGTEFSVEITPARETLVEVTTGIVKITDTVKQNVKTLSAGESEVIAITMTEPESECPVASAAASLDVNDTLAESTPDLPHATDQDSASKTVTTEVSTPPQEVLPTTEGHYEDQDWPTFSIDDIID